MDLRLTNDGEVVVFHDRNLARLTGNRARVSQLSLTQIRQYYLQNDPSVRIPTFQEALELIRDKLYIILDVKKESFRSTGLEERICKILNDFGLRDNIIVSSFNPLVLKKFAVLAPQFHLGFIFRSRSHIFMSNGTPLKSLHARYRILSQKYVAALQEKGYRIYAWTVDKADQMLKVIKEGADGIITNKPEIYYSLLSDKFFALTGGLF